MSEIKGEIPDKDVHICLNCGYHGDADAHYCDSVNRVITHGIENGESFDTPDMKLKEFYTVCETPEDKISYSGDPDYTNDFSGRIETDTLIPEMAFSHGWQKCPVCEGSGKRFMYSDTGENHFVSDYNDCETCKGKRIISTVTGKPPSDDR